MGYLALFVASFWLYCRSHHYMEGQCNTIVWCSYGEYGAVIEHEYDTSTEDRLKY